MQTFWSHVPCDTNSASTSILEYCKKLSKKDALGGEVSDIESESSEDEEKPFHHPFQVRDRPNSIILNIKVCEYFA